MLSDSELVALRRQVTQLRRAFVVLAAVVVVLALHAVDRASAQPAAPPTPPAPPAKSLSFVDGEAHVDIDATGVRITRPHAALAITADRITATAAEPGRDGSTIDLAVGAADAHIKALSELGSTSLVATPKSLCVAIKQIGGKDSFTCIPPAK